MDTNSIQFWIAVNLVLWGIIFIAMFVIQHKQWERKMRWRREDAEMRANFIKSLKGNSALQLIHSTPSKHSIHESREQA